MFWKKAVYELLIKQQIFRLVQIESICRRQNKCNLKTEILFGMGRKHCGKRRENAGYHHFLLFPQCFQTASFSGLLTHYQMTNFRLFRIKRLCRRQFQIDENGRKLSKPVVNAVGKGEIACDEQFLLFPQCFQKACFPGASKGVIVWEWVKSPDCVVKG